MVAIQSDSAEEDSFDPWGWLAPFDRAVWIMVVVTVVISSILYWLFERLDPDTDRRKNTPRSGRNHVDVCHGLCWSIRI
jgi:hypothetical protein